jgi:hypothetical protein
MYPVRDPFLSIEEFKLQVDSAGIVQLGLGPAQVSMTLDSAYNLQYCLAEFLAELELKEYQNNEDMNDDSRLWESQQNLVQLSRKP